MTDTADETGKKRKASGDNVTTLRTENMTSGEILRAAREKRKLSLEDVSSAIHVRTAQLRAIEEGNIDALPGMTYAVGFVKSYASYLKLNPVDLGNKFKAEHGALKPLMPDLPEIKPVGESRMPDPRLVGVAAFFAIVLLLGWTLFGNDDTAELEIATPDLIVESTAETDVAGVTQAVAEETPVETAGSPEDVAAPAAAPEPAKAEDKKADDKVVEAKKEVVAEKPVEEPAVEAVVEDAAQLDESATVAAQSEDEKRKAAAEAVAAIAAQQGLQADETIAIRKTGRIVFKARQTSWLQVSDAKERVVFKKLLRPGEQYTVPEGSGYTLITTNAGGLDVIVDGKQAPSLGKTGEILRGLPLEPAELTRVKRARSRINN